MAGGAQDSVGTGHQQLAVCGGGGGGGGAVWCVECDEVPARKRWVRQSDLFKQYTAFCDREHVEQRERPGNFYAALASFGIDSKKRRGTRGLVCVFHPDGKPDNSIDDHRVVAQSAV